MIQDSRINRTTNCSAGFKEIASEWNVSVNAVAKTNADLAMAIGWFTLLQSSLAIKIGRRPIFLFAVRKSVV